MGGVSGRKSVTQAAPTRAGVGWLHVAREVDSLPLVAGTHTTTDWHMRWVGEDRTGFRWVICIHAITTSVATIAFLSRE